MSTKPPVFEGILKDYHPRPRLYHAGDHEFEHDVDMAIASVVDVFATTPLSRTTYLIGLPAYFGRSPGYAESHSGTRYYIEVAWERGRATLLEHPLLAEFRRNEDYVDVDPEMHFDFEVLDPNALDGWTRLSPDEFRTASAWRAARFAWNAHFARHDAHQRELIFEQLRVMLARGMR